MDLTNFTIADIPTETRQALAARARQQTIDRYHQPSHIFTQAEAMVEAGHVQLTGRNCGMVYDETTVRSYWAGWLAVTPLFCSHCNDIHQPIICVHKLAIFYADLLARHPPDEAQTATGGQHARPTNPGIAGLGGGRYSGRLVSARRRRKGNGKHDHCPHCGGFLTSDGSCNSSRCGGGR